MWESDFSVADPYNFSSAWGNEIHYTNSASATGGPGNRSWLRQTHHVAEVHEQYYHGWEKLGLASLSQGQSRFFRWRLRVGAGFNATGVEDAWTSKFIIWGDGQVDGSERIMVHVAPRFVAEDFHISLGENISSERTPDYELTKGSWQSIQMEVQTSTTSSTDDGEFRVWINNDTYASPTEDFVGVSLNAEAMDNFRFGFYCNATLATGGECVLDFAQIQVATFFDDAWHSTLNG